MPVPKEQPPRKLSGPMTWCGKTLWRVMRTRIRRRDNDLRPKDRGGTAGQITCPNGAGRVSDR